MIKLAYGDEVLWPDHCVQGSRGAAFSDKLDLPMVQLVVRKGYHPHVDSYSGFLEADHVTKTGLGGYLRERGIRRASSGPRHGFLRRLDRDGCRQGGLRNLRDRGCQSRHR